VPTMNRMKSNAREVSIKGDKIFTYRESRKKRRNIVGGCKAGTKQGSYSCIRTTISREKSKATENQGQCSDIGQPRRKGKERTDLWSNGSIERGGAAAKERREEEILKGRDRR